jgi:ABC-type polysaccharide/polyol phosphate transport system ATPase subunit
VSYVVSLRDAGKRYIKYDDVPLLLTRALKFRAGNKRTHLWAVRHVDLDVEPGESVGVIGRNGSGKTTMFQMLAGVTGPTEGTVRVRGRVAPLISVGIGFNPELTGRENVYVNGTILGVPRREIDRRFDEIVAFAEIAKFIDTPVKFYSSGMFVRLGFSVAVAADPELLLVDEVLAVGDVAFQLRCYERMEEIRRNGATILVVSHNLNAIRRLCSKVLLLHDGQTRFIGDTDDGISRYHDILGELAAEEGETAPEVEILDFELVDEDGVPRAHLRTGDPATFRVRARFPRGADDPVFGFRLHKDSGQMIYAENSWTTHRGRVSPGDVVECTIRLRIALPTGTYLAYAPVRTGPQEDAPRARGAPLSFFVSGRPFVEGQADLEATFGLQGLGEALPTPALGVAHAWKEPPSAS